MATTTSDKATFYQKVSVEFEVLVEADRDYSDLTLDEVQGAVENWVKTEVMGSTLVDSTPTKSGVYASRGPSGYRYFRPGDEVEFASAKPIKVGLTELMEGK